MSTVAGIVLLEERSEIVAILEAMVQQGLHHGDLPELSFLGGQSVGLAHSALHSTAESRLETQPLSSSDDRFHITADARLDSRDALCSELGLDGKEVGDAGLILAAYRRWGEDVVDHLYGDFSFAIWDAERKVLVCARDAVGSRSFHYHLAQDGSFYFASGAQQLLLVPGVSGDLDGIALCDWLTANFRFHSRSAFAAIQCLPPGHRMTVGAGRDPRIKRYWRPETSSMQSGRSERDHVLAFRALLRNAVGDRLRTPTNAVAMMTSGGLDSSALAAVAQDLYRTGKSRSKPIAFVEAFDRYARCDERHYSDPLVEMWDLASEEIEVEAFTDLDGGLAGQYVVDHPSQVGDGLTRALFKKIRQRGCGVVTLGFGGDSLFDGARWAYAGHLRCGRLREWNQWVRAARRAGASWPGTIGTYLVMPLLTDGGRRRLDRWLGIGQYWQEPDWLSDSAKRAAQPERRRFLEVVPRVYDDPARQRQYVDIVGLAQQGPAMAQWGFHAARHGIEARYPLLDRRLAEFVLATPLDLSARPGADQSKWLLRRAMAEMLPTVIGERTDKGNWGQYLIGSLIGPYRDQVRSMFSNSRLHDLGLIRADRFLEALDGLSLDRSPRGIGLFYLALYAERWLRDHVADDARVVYSELAEWQAESS